MTESERLLLSDLIRRHGGSVRELERDGVTHFEVKVTLVDRTDARAELISEQSGVDAISW